MKQGLTKEKQRLLVEQFTQLGAGQAEAESRDQFRRWFLPVTEHVRAFDPDVTLVVGERGAGKSSLFNSVFQHGLIASLARSAPRVRLPAAEPGRTIWLPAYPIGRQFPDALGLRRCLAGEATAERALKLWFAYLLRAVQVHLEPEAKNRLEAILSPLGGAAGEVLRAFDSAGDEPLLALDRLDARLLREDRWLFVGYDELDTLGGFDWETMIAALRGLLAFWSGYSRRWNRLRAKIFLRTDLFRRHSSVGSADLAKLSANRAEITWSDRSLLAMLVKRVANTDDRFLGYCGTVRFDRDPDLGQVPTLARAEDARPLIENLAGEFMGASAKKGRTFRWILDHLRDGRNQASPRSLVQLMESAARRELDHPRALPPRLLHPTSLRQALEEVSAHQVNQAISSEWPWLYGVRERVRSSLVPWERRAVEDLLSRDWQGEWGQGRADLSPPAPAASELVSYLVELGVFRERRDGRVDAPDIYLFGLELRRKGGVKRK